MGANSGGWWGCGRRGCETQLRRGLPLSCGPLIALLGVCALDRAGAIDDILSYKSLVLGSLSSGERVSGRVSGGQCGRRDLRLFEL